MANANLAYVGCPWMMTRSGELRVHTGGNPGTVIALGIITACTSAKNFQVPVTDPGGSATTKSCDVVKVTARQLGKEDCMYALSSEMLCSNVSLCSDTDKADPHILEECFKTTGVPKPAKAIGTVIRAQLLKRSKARKMVSKGSSSDVDEAMPADSDVTADFSSSGNDESSDDDEAKRDRKKAKKTASQNCKSPSIIPGVPLVGAKAAVAAATQAAGGASVKPPALARAGSIMQQLAKPVSSSSSSSSSPSSSGQHRTQIGGASKPHTININCVGFSCLVFGAHVFGHPKTTHN
jgi:hypothetical protein